jgi:hypothetical protein
VRDPSGIPRDHGRPQLPVRDREEIDGFAGPGDCLPRNCICSHRRDWLDASVPLTPASANGRMWLQRSVSRWVRHEPRASGCRGKRSSSRLRQGCDNHGDNPASLMVRNASAPLLRLRRTQS